MRPCPQLPIEGRAGFSLIELLTVVMIGSIILLGAFQVIKTQVWQYTFEAESAALEGTLRGSALMLAQALIELSAAEGDFVAITSDSARIRAVLGGGMICSWKRISGEVWYGMASSSGNLAAQDSAFVYNMAGDAWNADRIEAVATGSDATAKIPACFFGDSTATTTAATTVAVRFTGATDTLSVGSPVRGFQHITYGLETREGFGWLVRRRGSDSTQAVAGPLLPISGLVLSYFDAAGNTTTTPADVAQVQVFLQGMSEAALSGGLGTLTDTVRVTVRLRN